MGYSQENGYTPVSFESIMSSFMDNVNTQFGTSYTVETFEGTNWYKFAYAIIQRMQLNEVKTSEIFLKLQQYIDIINARISRPVNTNPGIIDKFLEQGYIASVKPMIDADAGKIHIAVDTDETDPDYLTTKAAIGLLISQITAGGAVTQGTEVVPIVLSNGQEFDFKFNLPNRIDVKLKLTITLSENNQLAVGDPDDTKIKLLNNILSRYRLGKNFEPQRYFNQADAPWSGQVLLEWSDDDGVTWNSSVFDSNYDDLFSFGLDDITLIEVS